MRLIRLTINNFRSIRNSGNVRIEPLQALVGENNCGKSNILRALKCFLTASAGGCEVSDFTDQDQPVTIECEFSGLSAPDKKRLRPYLLSDVVFLRKELKIEHDVDKGKSKVVAEYHGYQAEPKEIHYSMDKIESASRKDWQVLARAGGFEALAQDAGGKFTKTSFKTGLQKYLATNDVEYDPPVLGQTHALGISPNLLSALPKYYLLPAITDYSTEVDRRSSSTIFRQLMGDLSDRLIRTDPRYAEVEEAVKKIKSLLNSEDPATTPRLAAIGKAEAALTTIMSRMMPSVAGVNVNVDIEPPKDIFSKGVTIKVDDGVLTDVLDKGNGMQRTLVFSLLQMLIDAARESGSASSGIILAIEEPELYIHPHSQRLIFEVLKSFSGIQEDGTATGEDQVLYSTHSPAFVDIGYYERVALVRKKDLATGTTVQQCTPGILGSLDERKGFKLLTSFGLEHNEVFFSRDVVLVEGIEDKVGIIATARKLGLFKKLPDELGLSIAVVDGKGEMPKFQKVLNGFGLAYGVLLELDGKPETDKENGAILAEIGGNRIEKVPKRVEDMLGVSGHFKDVRHAKEFFSDPAKINVHMEATVKGLISV